MKRTWVLGCLPVVALLTLGLGACGSDEAPSAGVEVPAADAGGAGNLDAGGGGAGGSASDAAGKPPEEAGPPVRTVETRSRFGTLDPNNLLLDGDFELSGPDAEQYPWFQFTAANVALGMQCRSGLRCAKLQPGNLIAGVFVWPDGPVEAGFYAHVQGKSCDSEAVGYITPIQSYPQAPLNPTQLNADNSAPDKDGYCHYAATMSQPADTGNTFWTLIIADHRSATGPIIVDDAVVRASSSTSSLRAAAGPPTAEAVEIVQRARDAYAKRPPIPPQRTRAPIFDRTGRLGAHYRTP